jgi:multiple sugar transport system substrate-binding protein
LSLIARRGPRVAIAAFCVVMSVVMTAACARGGVRNTDPDSIKVWIVEDLPDRVAATQEIVDAYERESGVEVELVAVAEDQFNQLLLSSAGAGDLPDVVGAVPLGQVWTMSANELIDAEATATVMDSLGEDTFTDNALELTRDGDTQLAVPSEAWTQLLVYRKDLFAQAGLEPPATYEALLAAAEELDSEDMAGFTGATIAGDAFTAQTFEYLALANGCDLVDDDGEVAFASDECVEALRTYQELVRERSVPGAQDVDTTRAAYFAGTAAMVIWSAFILDEMAGLRDDAKPTCPQCEADPAFLAKNSGIVTALEGPSGEPAVYGEVTSWVVTAAASRTPAQGFVEYMMNPGYRPWIEIAPEGKFPVRTGDATNPRANTDMWPTLPVGVDTKAPLADFYGPDVLTALTDGPDQASRWAIPQGEGNLVGALQGEQPVAKAVNDVANGTDPEEAAADAAEAIRAIQDSLR